MFTLQNWRSFIKFLELTNNKPISLVWFIHFWILCESIFSLNSGFVFRLMVFWNNCEVELKFWYLSKYSYAFSTITVQTSIDIRFDTIFISVLNIKITHWSWISPQIATKIDNLTFDFYYMEYKLRFGCQKTLAIIFSSNLGCFNNLLRPYYWSQWPQ